MRVATVKAEAEAAVARLNQVRADAEAARTLAVRQVADAEAAATLAAKFQVDAERAAALAVQKETQAEAVAALAAKKETETAAALAATALLQAREAAHTLKINLKATAAEEAKLSAAAEAQDIKEKETGQAILVKQQEEVVMLDASAQLKADTQQVEISKLQVKSEIAGTQPKAVEKPEAEAAVQMQVDLDLAEKATKNAAAVAKMKANAETAARLKADAVRHMDWICQTDRCTCSLPSEFTNARYQRQGSATGTLLSSVIRCVALLTVSSMCC